MKGIDTIWLIFLIPIMFFIMLIWIASDQYERGIIYEEFCESQEYIHSHGYCYKITDNDTIEAREVKILNKKAYWIGEWE